MIKIRRSGERGLAEIGWLKSWHTFSFDQYYDPAFMHFGSLRVINEDTIQSGQGFGMHPHQNMEIITYVIEGVLQHQDSMGNGSTIIPGEIQRMSAGTGIHHGEFNGSQHELLHLLQIWIIPAQKNITPSYEQKKINKVTNQFILIGSPDGRNDSVTIHQDVEIYAAYLLKDSVIQYGFRPERQAWLQLVRGGILLEGYSLVAGDGAAIKDLSKVEIICYENAELLLFDLA